MFVTGDRLSMVLRIQVIAVESRFWAFIKLIGGIKPLNYNWEILSKIWINRNICCNKVLYGAVPVSQIGIFL